MSRTSKLHRVLAASESHYPPVSDTLRRWGAYITGVGKELIPPRAQYPRQQEHPTMYGFRWSAGRVLPEYAVVLITRGRGEFESACAGTHDVNSPCAFFLFPGEWHRYRPAPETGWHESWMTMHGERIIHLAELLRLSPDSPARQLPTPLAKSVYEDISAVCSHFSRTPSANDLVQSSAAMRIMALASEHQPCHRPAAQKMGDSVASHAIDLIWSRSHHRLTVELLAQLLNVGRRRLERAMRRATGRSVHEEILRCRMARARRLLEDTNLPIKHISYLAGFDSPERLRIAMIEETGIPPRRFRKQVQATRSDQH